ncbi:MAG: condensation domain-containing protein, partial [Bradymonadaceae bacterium]
MSAADFPRVDEQEFERLAAAIHGDGDEPGGQIAEIRSEIEDIYELSPLQQGLLVEYLAQPDAGVYLIQTDATFDAEITAEELRRAWLSILERHDILRTEFYWEGLSEPLQVVRSNVEVP